MKNCKQSCNNKQIKVNNKQKEINKIDNKPDTYSIDELQQFDELKTELKNLTLDLQRCIDDCNLRNRHRGPDNSNDDTQVDVDPDILQELKALEEEEEDLEGGRTRSTIRRRNKSKTKRRQTRSTRRRKTRHCSTRRTRKQ